MLATPGTGEIRSSLQVRLNINRRRPCSWAPPFLAITVLLAGFAATQTGTAGPGRSDNILYAELTKAPAKASARRNPLEHDRDAVAAGAKLYALHCAECHGETGEGGKAAKKGPSLRADEVQQAAPGTLFWLLTNGVVRRGMPVWSKLPEPQRWQLVSYIKSLSANPKVAALVEDAAHRRTVPRILRLSHLPGI
jgi:mono/diheme cytochrome c family protein